MSLVSLSLAAAMASAIEPRPCGNEVGLRKWAIEIVRSANEGQQNAFNSLVADNVTMDVWFGDNGLGIRTDERYARAFGDSRQQLMKHFKSWNFNRYTLRRSGIICTLQNAVQFEFISDAEGQSFFLKFEFNGDKLARLDGQGYFIADQGPIGDGAAL